MENDLLTQHKEIYFGSIKELITNNTKALIEDDLLPFFMSPPLETMDTIKQRLLSLAKDYTLILDSNNIDKYLNIYRKNMQEETKKLGKIREAELLKELEKIKKDQREETFKLLKKDLIKLNQRLKKEYKQVILKNMQETFEQNISLFFTNRNIPEALKKDINKFFKVTYPNQILEGYSMKILVKDTILMNGIKEQTQRFIFTKENSHLFD